MHLPATSGMTRRAKTLARLEQLYALLGHGYIDYQLELGRLKEKSWESGLDFPAEQSGHVRTTTSDRRKI
jgi:hypothetical protein